MILLKTLYFIYGALVFNYGVQISLKNQFELQMSSGLIKSTLNKFEVYLILSLELNHGVKRNDNKRTLRNGVLLLRF